MLTTLAFRKGTVETRYSFLQTKHLDRILAALEAQLPKTRPSTESSQATAANRSHANVPRDQTSERQHSPERTDSDSVQKEGEERKRSPCAAASLNEDAPGVSETGQV
jgi:hypothetical protein